MHRKQTTCRTRGKSSGVSRRPTKVSPSVASTPTPPTGRELLEVVMRGDCEAVTALLKKGGNVNTLNLNTGYDDGSTLLIRAAGIGNLAMMQCLVTHGVNINKKTNNGETALTTVAKIGHLDAVKYLIGQGAEINPENMIVGHKPKAPTTAVFEATLHGHFAVIEYLIGCGADVNLRVDSASFGVLGATPLILAAKKGDITIVKYLIANGAKVDITAVNGYSTAISYAISEGHLEIVEYLFACGADIHKSHIIMSAVGPNSHVGILQFLHKHGVNFNTPNETTGQTPLHAELASRKRLDILQFLLAVGANVNAKDLKGKSPLMSSAVGESNTLERITIIECLLSNGARINDKDKEGNTALHYTGMGTRASLEIAECLIKYGADAKAKNYAGDTPAMLAHKKKHAKLAQCLLDASTRQITPAVIVHHHAFSPSPSIASAPSLWATPKPLPPTPKPLPSLPMGSAIARYPYVAASAEEISIVQGQKLIIIEKRSDGWWRCQADTKIGLAPSNYLEEEIPLPSLSPFGH